MPVSAFEEADGVTRIPLALEPCGSVFVVFRPGAAPDRWVSVTRNGEELLRGDKPAAKPAVATNLNTFSIVAWAKPALDTALPREASVGTVAKLPRNDALYPPPGHEVWGAGHAGAGFAVGRNGVCVHEHGAQYFSTSLAFAAPLFNAEFAASRGPAFSCHLSQPLNADNIPRTANRQQATRNHRGVKRRAAEISMRGGVWGASLFPRGKRLSRLTTSRR